MSAPGSPTLRSHRAMPEEWREEAAQHPVAMHDWKQDEDLEQAIRS